MMLGGIWKHVTLRPAAKQGLSKLTAFWLCMIRYMYASYPGHGGKWTYECVQQYLIYTMVKYER